MPACPAFDPLGPYVTGLIEFVDCHARALGDEGYHALGFGSPVGLALTGLLTIYVALIGYRMLLGDMPSLHEGVVSVVRIGFVLALASQWSAYHALVYNVAIEAPSEIAARILGPGGLGGGDLRSLTDRVQGTYSAIEQAARPEPVPVVEVAVTPSPKGVQPVPANPPVPVALLAVPVDPTLGLAGQILLVASLAGLLSVRIVAGLMLALGPLFIAFFLFGAMRGLFEGWVRVLAGATFGAIAVAAVLAIELAILEPQVVTFLSARAAQEPVPLLGDELLATTALFALVLLAVLVAITRAAAGFRLPEAIRRESIRLFGQDQLRQGQTALAAPAAVVAANDDRPRARGLADAVAAIERREQRAEPSDRTPDRRVTTLSAATQESTRLAPEPIGQSHRRTARQRRSASAARRDTTG